MSNKHAVFDLQRLKYWVFKC